VKGGGTCDGAWARTNADVNPATTAIDANHNTIHFCMLSSV
jgi:hypothetical protein